MQVNDILAKLGRQMQKTDKALRVLNARKGPGRKTLYTLHKRIDRSGVSIYSGNYLLAGDARRAVRRFARWMAANPNAKSNREAPDHIIRNAALAAKQMKGRE